MFLYIFEAIRLTLNPQAGGLLLIDCFQLLILYIYIYIYIYIPSIRSPEQLSLIFLVIFHVEWNSTILGGLK